MSEDRARDTVTPRVTRYLVGAAFVLALLGALFQAQHFVADALASIRFQWELDYGEGIVWEQMRLMFEGRGYGSISQLPAIVFHYPPVYHTVVAMVIALGGLDPLSAGRWVSFGATLVAAMLVALLAARAVAASDRRSVAIICALVAGLVFPCFAPVAQWAPLMRVDMVSLAFSLAGMLVAMGALARPRLIYASSLFFVAAVFTKQTAIVAPAAVFVTFCLVRKDLAWRLVASCVALGVAVLGTLAVATDGAIIRHLFFYNANRLAPIQLLFLAEAILSYRYLLIAISFGMMLQISTRWRAFRQAAIPLRQHLQTCRQDFLLVLTVLYSFLAFLMAFAIAKSGANVNYLIEWLTSLAILSGIAARPAARALVGIASEVSGGARSSPILAPLAVALVPLLIGAQMLVLEPAKANAARRAGAETEELVKLEKMIRSADAPVISDDMVLLRRAGVPVQWEPAIFAELASTGIWKEEPFIALVKARRFAFFITDGSRGKRVFDSRYNPGVADAMDEAYPVKRRLAGYTLHLPSQ